MDEIRYQIGGDGGQYTDAQAAGHTVGLVGHQFLDALGLVQGYLCLTDYLLPMGVGVMFFRSRLNTFTSSSSSSF